MKRSSLPILALLTGLASCQAHRHDARPDTEIVVIDLTDGLG